MIKFWFESALKLKKNNKKQWRIVYKIGKAFVNFLFPLLLLTKRKKLNSNSDFVVSLTTYPARIKEVGYTIETLFRQTVMPRDIFLWLSKEQFGDSKLPRSLKKLEKNGLKILFCDDLKPHKKYYYMKKYLEKFSLITADDDIYYPSNHFEKLIKASRENPNDVICLAHQVISFNQGKEFETYTDWPVRMLKKNPSFLYLAIGANGILYPKKCLPDTIYSKKAIKENALMTDDLWLKSGEILNNVKTFVAEPISLAYFNNIKTSKQGLWKNNVYSERLNDKNWKKICESFPIVKKVLYEAWNEEKVSS